MQVVGDHRGKDATAINTGKPMTARAPNNDVGRPRRSLPSTRIGSPQARCGDPSPKPSLPRAGGRAGRRRPSRAPLGWRTGSARSFELRWTLVNESPDRRPARSKSSQASSTLLIQRAPRVIQSPRSTDRIMAIWTIPLNTRPDTQGRAAVGSTAHPSGRRVQRLSMVS